MKTTHQSTSRIRYPMPSMSASKESQPTWTRYLLPGSCLIGLGLILVHVRPGSTGGPIEPPQKARGGAQETPTAIASDGGAEQRAASLGLKKGERLTYRFNQDRSIHLRGASFGGMISKGAASQSVALRVRQEGNFVLNVYEETEKGWVVGFTVQDAMVQMDAGEASALSDGSEAALRTEILAFVEKSGRIGRMTTPTPTTPEALNHWRDILSRWQTVLPENPSARKWDHTEEDATGVYRAHYSRDTNQPSVVLHKQKQQYLSLNSVSSHGLEGRSKVSGTANIQLDPYPTHIEGREQLTILTPEIGGSVSSESAYTFHIQSAVRVREVEEAGVEASKRFEVSDHCFSWAPKEDASRPAPEVDTEGTTIEEQLAGLETLLAEGMSGTPTELKTLEKIVALIKKDDSSVDAIVDRLGQRVPLQNQDLASALIGMLGAAGTPKAQRTLIGLVGTDEWPLDHREMAVFSFAQVSEPVPEVDSWLRQLHEKGDELSNSSLLVLAAMGKRVREQNPERFRSISEYVVEAANVPGLEINEKVVSLDAIGNLGPHEVPEVVRDALASDDPLLREKAVLSLKRVEDSAAYWLIRDSLQADSAEGVRIAAARLLADTRWTDGFDDLSYAAIHDASEHVRAAAIISLGEWFDTNAEANRVLQQAANQDPSQDVRDAATEILRSRFGFEADEEDAPLR
ncbi:MAG: HEAT repeat domain-containing protein [Verrucomicrobia bacterium]|nr:HEAT repeat domain-containing protein [Verrucomicrobiota bacterium]